MPISSSTGSRLPWSRHPENQNAYLSAGPTMESKLFIDGKWCAPRDGGTLDVINPADERVFHRCAAGTAEDIDAAVAAAKAALAGPWSRTSGHDRAKYLRAIAAKIEEQKQAL